MECLLICREVATRFEPTSKTRRTDSFYKVTKHLVSLCAANFPRYSSDIKRLEIICLKFGPPKIGSPVAFETHLVRGVLPTWLIFATKIFLSVYHTLRTDIKRGFSELNLAADCALTSLQAYFKHAQSYPTEDTKKVQDIACMALRLVTQYIKRDIFLELYKEFSFDNAVEIGHQMKRKPFNFLSSYPVLCGLMAVCTFSESLYPFQCLIAHEAFAALRTRLSLSR
jgi:hypothetical protein